MNTTTKAEQNALTLPQRATVALGAAEHEIKLRELVKSSADIVAVIDPAGREQAHRIGMTLKNARVSIEKTGKAAREDATAFSKAVIAEEKRLVDIVTDEENRVFGLRDEFDAKVEAERQAKIAAERARVEAIQARITEIQRTPLIVVGQPSVIIDRVIQSLIEDEIDDSYEEFLEQAKSTHAEALAALQAAMTTAMAAEATALREKAEREAEAKRLEDERAELAKLRAEAAERDRLAKIETDRIAAEAQAVANAEIKAAQDRLNAERAEFERQQNEAAEAEAERVRLQAASDQMLADAHAAPLIDLLPAELVESAETEAPAPFRPSNDDLVQAIAERFNVPRGIADDWLCEFESVME